MIYRLLAIFKRIVFGFFRVLCCILRCGRRKKVQVDDSLPTDIVIGDAVSASFPTPNGYEVPSPGYYDQLHEPRHPFQSQVAADYSERQLNQSEDVQLQSWDQWDYGDASAMQKNEIQSHHNDNNAKVETPEEEDIDFFADMEPSVKVKKIYVKKKQKEDGQQQNRFALDQSMDFKKSGDFNVDWQDDDDGEGWDDQDADIGEIDTAKVAKEARQLRKQERMQRTEEQKRQKLAKKSSHHKEHRFGTKVS